MASRLTTVLLGTMLSLAACGDDDLEAERDGGRTRSDASASDAGELDGGQGAGPVQLPDAAAPLDAAAVDAQATRDASSVRPAPTNVSFESAKRIEPDGLAPLQDELSAEQVDYYVFAGSAGQFFELSTDRTPFSPDLVISLYDAERNLLAQNDEGSIWPGQAVDARMVVRLPAGGDYYIVVDDPYTPPQFFQGVFPLLYYHLRVHAVGDGVSGFALAHGSKPQLSAFAHDDKSGYDYITVVGELGAEPGVFDLDGLAAHALIGRFQLPGAMGNGSTAAGGEITVADASGHVLARIDRAQEQAAIDPPVEAASYRVTVNAGSELGDNPFYALDFVMLEDNPREQDEAGNGELSGAEAVALPEVASRRGLLIVSLPENDVDYFKFDATASERASITCEGESGGSGVRGLLAELRDDTDQVLASATETPTLNLHIDPFTLDRTATYYLRLTSTTPKTDTGSVDPWTRCAVIVGP